MSDSKCFVCGAPLTYDSTTGRYTCSVCGNVQATVYDQGTSTAES